MRALFLVLLFALLLGSSAAAGQGVLRVAVDEAYPPFSFRNPDTGQFTGFDVDIMNALCAAMGRTCTLVPLPFERIIPEMVAGTIDMAVAGMSKTPEREEQVLFGDKYFRTTSIFIEVPGSVHISPEGLRGKRIAVQKSTIQETYLLATYGAAVVIKTYASSPEVIRAVAEGSADAGFIEGLPAYYELMSQAGLKLDIAGEPVRLADAAHIVLRQGLTEEREAVNAALKAIRASGEYDKISHTYFTFNVY